MITKDNFKEVLEILGFKSEGEIYSKDFANNVKIKVDFEKQEIAYAPLAEGFKNGDYPSLKNPSEGFIIHRDTTTNFNSNENFVCLLCVNALLSKGYKPEHIILEPTFKVGHNQQVYGDILVLNQNFENLILIENKTAGNEFSKEWKNTEKNGGQLFSYYAVNKAPFLCLLTYDFDNTSKTISYISHIITMQDNQKHLDSLNINLKDDEKKLAFSNPKNSNARDYYKIWNETYQLTYTTKGLLEPDVQSYCIGKEKYTIKDLSIVPYNQIARIYHEFATILRNNAIGNYENTFYILVDLFLCKIVDEIYNAENLQFYYKGVSYDNPLEYCDRLLNLYEIGIEKLFKKQVVNIKKDSIDKIFNTTKRYKGALKDEIEKIFTMQKFFNIKKFNFIEVENEEEFFINFKVLIRIVNLIQDFYISQSENNQFLGDLFEGFLNRSVHQTEGRFFTPTPITNFIIYSLPNLAKDCKVLDFACGAGHFLTEFITHHKDARLYGIEKNKDLSKVAKIACIFHNSNPNSQATIIFQDTLDSIKHAYKNDFKEANFDLILSNPPYSVKGFLSTLQESVLNKFSLINDINIKNYDKNNAIECFFIERAKQFLKNDGIFALILPVSILNKDNVYEKTRNILLEHFKLLAIVELNKRTFSSTGTQTMIIFAKKVQKLDDISTFLKEQNYNDKSLENEFLQTNFLQKYCEFMSYGYDDFKAFLRDNILSDELRHTEAFNNYFDDLNSSKPKVFKKDVMKLNENEKESLFEKSSFYRNNLSNKEQKQIYSDFLKSQEYQELEQAFCNEKFFSKIKECENEKMRYFSYIQNNELVLIKSPQDKNTQNKSNKANVIKFLGYDWSKRKGDEGIKYQTTKIEDENLKEKKDDSDEEKKEKESLRNINSIKFIDTPLYNPNDKSDNTKLNYAIKAFIEDKEDFTEIIKRLNPEEKDAHSIALVHLKDMINFKNAKFNKVIDLNPALRADGAEQVIQNPFENCEKYDLVRLEDLILENPKSKIKVQEAKKNKNGAYPFYTSGLNIYRYDEALTSGENIYLSTGGNAIVQFYNGESAYSTDTYVIKSNNSEKALTKFIFYLLEIQTRYINEFLFKGITIKHLQKSEFKNLKIPLPPLEIQKQIVAECEKVEEQYNTIRMSVEEYQKLIKAILIKCGICEDENLLNGGGIG